METHCGGTTFDIVLDLSLCSDLRETPFVLEWLDWYYSMR